MNGNVNWSVKLLVSALAALTVAGISYSAYGGDAVRTRSEYERPGRQLDSDPPKLSADTKSFWKSIDDEGRPPVRSGDGSKKFGRAVDDERASTSVGTQRANAAETKSFWNNIAEEGGPPVRSGDGTKKYGRAVADPGTARAKPGGTLQYKGRGRVEE